jgi:hypothetical protein
MDQACVKLSGMRKHDPFRCGNNKLSSYALYDHCLFESSYLLLQRAISHWSFWVGFFT